MYLACLVSAVKERRAKAPKENQELREGNAVFAGKGTGCQTCSTKSIIEAATSADSVSNRGLSEIELRP